MYSIPSHVHCPHLYRHKYVGIVRTTLRLDYNSVGTPYTCNLKLWQNNSKLYLLKFSLLFLSFHVIFTHHHQWASLNLWPQSLHKVPFKNILSCYCDFTFSVENTCNYGTVLKWLRAWICSPPSGTKIHRISLDSKSPCKTHPHSTSSVKGWDVHLLKHRPELSKQNAYLWHLSSPQTNCKRDP